MFTYICIIGLIVIVQLPLGMLVGRLIRLSSQYDESALADQGSTPAQPDGTASPGRPC